MKPKYNIDSTCFLVKSLLIVSIAINIFLSLEIGAERESNYTDHYATTDSIEQILIDSHNKQTLMEGDIDYIRTNINDIIDSNQCIDSYNQSTSLLEQRNLIRHDYCNSLLQDNYDEYHKEYGYSGPQVLLDVYYNDDMQVCILEPYCSGCDGFTSSIIYSFK